MGSRWRKYGHSAAWKRGGMETVTKVTVPKCSHRGNSVRVGNSFISAGGTQYFQTGDLTGYDLVIPLTEGKLPLEKREPVTIMPYYMEDFGGVPGDWADFIQDLSKQLEEGYRILIFCVGSHGRTGTLLASLISLLEPLTEDPIAETRMRHCSKAVETLEQAKVVFKIRGKPVPSQYMEEFGQYRHVIIKNAHLAPKGANHG